MFHPVSCVRVSSNTLDGATKNVTGVVTIMLEPGAKGDAVNGALEKAGGGTVQGTNNLVIDFAGKHVGLCTGHCSE